MQHRARRIGISQSHGSAPFIDLAVGDPPTTPADFALLDESCGLLPAFVSLLPADRKEIFEFFRRRTFPMGTPVLLPGAEMIVVHVIESGTITCYERDRRLKRADRLGELGTIQSSVCEVAWVAEEETTCWVIDRRQLNVALHSAAARRRHRATQVLSDLPMMQGLNLQQVLQLIDVSKREEAPAVRPRPDAAGTAFLEVITDGFAFVPDHRAVARSPQLAQRVAEDNGPFFASGVSPSSAAPYFCVQGGDAYGQAVRIARSADTPGALGSLPDPSVSSRAVSDSERAATCVILSISRDVFERVLGSPEALLRAPGPLAAKDAVTRHEAAVAQQKAAAAAAAAAAGGGAAHGPPPTGSQLHSSGSSLAKLARIGSEGPPPSPSSGKGVGFAGLGPLPGAGAAAPAAAAAVAAAQPPPMPVASLPPMPSVLEAASHLGPQNRAASHAVRSDESTHIASPRIEPASNLISSHNMVRLL